MTVAETTECFSETDEYGQPIPQGQLFENWYFVDESLRPQGWAFFAGEQYAFGERGIGFHERVAINQDFPWARILDEFAIESESTHDPSKPVYPRHVDATGTVYEDMLDMYRSGDQSNGDKLDFVAAQLGIDGPDRDKVLYEWFSERNDHSWTDVRQLKFRI